MLALCSSRRSTLGRRTPKFFRPTSRMQRHADSAVQKQSHQLPACQVLYTNRIAPQRSSTTAIMAKLNAMQLLHVWEEHAATGAKHVLFACWVTW